MQKKLKKTFLKKHHFSFFSQIATNWTWKSAKKNQVKWVPHTTL